MLISFSWSYDFFFSSFFRNSDFFFSELSFFFPWNADSCFSEFSFFFCLSEFGLFFLGIQIFFLFFREIYQNSKKFKFRE